MLKSGSQAWFRSVLIQSCPVAQSQSTCHCWPGLGSSAASAVPRHHWPLGARSASFSLSSEMLHSLTLNTVIFMSPCKHLNTAEAGERETQVGAQLNLNSTVWVWALPHYRFTQFPPSQLGFFFILQSTFRKCLLQILNWPSLYWVNALHLVAAVLWFGIQRLDGVLVSGTPKYEWWLLSRISTSVISANIQ